MSEDLANMIWTFFIAIFLGGAIALITYLIITKMG
jgi:hypothetical protein